MQNMFYSIVNIIFGMKTTTAYISSRLKNNQMPYAPKTMHSIKRLDIYDYDFL